MTRREFDEIDCFYDLQEACEENRIDYMDNFMDQDSMDSQLCESIRDATNHLTWDEIRDNLSCIDGCGEGWYRKDSEWEYVYVDNDFDEVKDEVREIFEQLGLFEDDEDDEIEPEYYHEDFPEYPLPPTRVKREEPCKDIGDDMPVQTLFSDCSSKLQKISACEPEKDVFPF